MTFSFFFIASQGKFTIAPCIPSSVAYNYSNIGNTTLFIYFQYANTYDATQVEKHVAIYHPCSG